MVQGNYLTAGAISKRGLARFLNSSFELHFFKMLQIQYAIWNFYLKATRDGVFEKPAQRRIKEAMLNIASRSHFTSHINPFFKHLVTTG
jgi:hypothetical protein